MPSKPTKIKRKKTIVLQPKDMDSTQDVTPKSASPSSGPVRRKVVKKPAASGKIPTRQSQIRSKSRVSEEINPEELIETVDMQVPTDIDSLPVGKPVSIPENPTANPLDPSGKEFAPTNSSREVVGEPTFKFFCYRCGQKLIVPVSWANKSYPCGRCHHEIVIPPPLIGNIW